MITSLSILWGSSFLAIKEVIDIFPPLLVFAIRFSISGVMLLAIFFFHEAQHNREHIGWKQWKDAIILGAAIILGRQGLLIWGTQYLSSGVTALLNSNTPLWAAILATLADKQGLTNGIAFGLALSFMGLLILINPFEVNATLNLTGILSLTLSSIFWALGSLYSTRSNIPVSILASGGMLMFVGAIMLFLQVT
jgi:drug/metabolite transporter (DMT)-like permease